MPIPPAARPQAFCWRTAADKAALWTYGISGDTPLVLLRVTDSEKIELVRQLIQAHSYWRAKGLTVELVILNEDVSVYRQNLQDQITVADRSRQRSANAR